MKINKYLCIFNLVHQRVYKIKSEKTNDESIIIKHRFNKSYRHPLLDKQLIKSRIQSEVKALNKCLENKVNVPVIKLVDVQSGVIGMELVKGFSVREWLGSEAEGKINENDDDGQPMNKKLKLQDIGLTEGECLVNLSLGSN